MVISSFCFAAKLEKKVLTNQRKTHFRPHSLIRPNSQSQLIEKAANRLLTASPRLQRVIHCIAIRTRREMSELMLKGG